MKKINKKDMKVGDFVYLEYKQNTNNRIFWVEVKELGFGENEWDRVKYWALKKLTKGKSIPLLEIKDGSGIANLDKDDWESYDLYKLNKEEVSMSKRLIILYNLK